MTYYLALALNNWKDNVSITLGGVPIGSVDTSSLENDGCIGFLPVYDSREAAELAHPNRPVLAITTDELPKSVALARGRKPR